MTIMTFIFWAVYTDQATRGNTEASTERNQMPPLRKNSRLKKAKSVDVSDQGHGRLLVITGPGFHIYAWYGIYAL